MCWIVSTEPGVAFVGIWIVTGRLVCPPALKFSTAGDTVTIFCNGVRFTCTLLFRFPITDRVYWVDVPAGPLTDEELVVTGELAEELGAGWKTKPALLPPPPPPVLLALIVGSTSPVKPS